MTVTHGDVHSASDRTQEMVGELEGLLLRQIDLAREGNFGQVEQLATRADALAAAIVEGSSSASSLESEKARLKTLYDELALALRAERGEVRAKLTQLRQVKRAVGAYGRKTGR